MHYWKIRNIPSERIRSAGPIIALLLAVALTGGMGCAAEARELVDATGVKVSVPDRPMRIVTLTPALAELAADFLGTELERIVGVSEYTDYPPALSRTRTVGAYVRFNVETVAALKPDLVLATTDGNPKDQVLRLRELGVPVIVIATDSFEQVEASLILTGQALGSPASGERKAAQFRTGLARFRERAEAREKEKKGGRRKVLLQLADNPLVVAGGKSFLHDALKAVGADNAYGDLTAGYPKPSREDVIRRDPDIILILSMGREHRPFQEAARTWRRFPALKAVKNQGLKVLEADVLVRPTLRLLEGLSQLERAVYGEK